MSSSMGRVIPYIMESKKWLKPPTRLDTDWNHKPDFLIRRPAEKCWSFTQTISPHPHPSCKVATEFGLHLHRRHPGLNGLVKWLFLPGSPLLSLLKSPMFIHFGHGFWDMLPPRHFGKATIFGGDSCHQMAWPYPALTWWSNAVRSERLWQQLAKPKQATSVPSGYLT